jgi:hypothetical protein
MGHAQEGTMRAIFTSLIGLTLLPAISGAAELRSEYTDLKYEQCTTISSDEVGGTSVCPGLRGYPVVIGEGDLRQSVSYGVQAMAEKAMNQGFSAFNHTGTKIEWLVDASDKDNLQPVATVLRWFIAGEDGNDKYQLLVVTQVKLGATCWIGLIDAQAVKDANAVARKLAQDKAGKFDCENDPEIVQPFKVPAVAGSPAVNAEGGD